MVPDLLHADFFSADDGLTFRPCLAGLFLKFSKALSSSRASGDPKPGTKQRSP